jgi:mRNA interferase RelE/StbE
VKKIAFTEQASADVRRLDIPTAMRVFAALHRFAETGVGDVKKLRGDTEESRLRVGDYRVRFVEEADAIHIKRVLHRSEAYR